MTLQRFAHFSDAHLGPLPDVRVHELLGKRITGYINYSIKRSNLYDMGLLARIVDDMRAQAPDHILCTGDLINIGLASEFEGAAKFLEALSDPAHLMLVPGNHDIYVRGALKAMMTQLEPYLHGEPVHTFQSDRPSTRAATHANFYWPRMRQLGPTLILGLNSGVPTLPFRATGRLGEQQIAQAETVLEKAGKDGLCRIIMIHHPPHILGAKPGRELEDAVDFEAMLARTGAELVLHGHNHVVSLAYRPGPTGQIPILGAASASLRSESPLKRASYHLIEVARSETGYAIQAITRGPDEDGSMRILGKMPLNRP